MSTIDEMPDVALDRTEDRIDVYLETILSQGDVTVHRENTQWTITAHTNEPTGIGPLDRALSNATDRTIRLLDRSGLETTDGETDLGPDEYERTADGTLIESILKADTQMAPVDYWRVVDGISDISDPDWIGESPIEVVDRSFQPYYDRTAVCICFEASIETVSEFERNIVLPVAIDPETGQYLSRLADWFKSVTAMPSPDSERVERVNEPSIPFDIIDDALSDGRQYVESAISPAIESAQQRAERAANAELEEFAELQEEKIRNLQYERQQLSERLEEIAERLENAQDRSGQLDALEKRSELREKRDEIVSELEALESARTDGFPQKRRGVRDRHSIEVEIEALTVTVLEYEKGDLVMKLREGDHSDQITVPYGRGVGATDEVACENCGSPFDSTNHILVTDDGLGCQSCRE